MDQKNKRMWAAVIGVSLVLLLVFAGVYATGQSAYEAKVQERKDRITELTASLSEASEAKDDAMTAEDAEGMVSSAKSAGSHAADLENTYMSVLHAADLSETDRMAQLTDLSSQMDALFGENTPLRTAWYTWDVSRLASAVWSFQTNADFSGDQMQVLWTCTDDAGDLLAYVTADYQKATDTFANGIAHATIIGSQYFPYTGEETAGVDQNTDSVFLLQNVAGLSPETQSAYDTWLSDDQAQSDAETNSNLADSLNPNMNP